MESGVYVLWLLFPLVPASLGSVPRVGLFTPDPDTSEPVPGEFVAVLENGATVQSLDAVSGRLAADFSLQTVRRLKVGALQALWLTGSEADVEVAVNAVPQIRYVEPNKWIYAMQQSMCIQQSVSEFGWGLDRIDQRTAVVNPNGVYEHTTTDAGQGVDVYVMDTGIYLAHPEFQGRAQHGYTALNITDGDDDLNGHGTHVAGTIGSVTWGVAKTSRLTAVKVLDGQGSGTTAGLVDGLDWVLSDHYDKMNQAGVKPRAVINLSLGLNGTSPLIEEALSNVIANGLTAVVAAGNDYADACGYSPARVPTAVTVAASTLSDSAAFFANIGTCVDLFAPGHEIVSTWVEVDDPAQLAMLSGTSMAAPHVTGAVARYLSRQSEAPLPSSVRTWLLSEATTGALTLLPAEASTPNELLYVDCGVGRFQHSTALVAVLPLAFILYTFN